MKRKEMRERVARAIKYIIMAQGALVDVNLTTVALAKSNFKVTLQWLCHAEEDLKKVQK